MTTAGMWDLDPSITYLNHGAYGAVPKQVTAEQERWRRLMESDPTDFFARKVDRGIDEARSAVCTAINADPEGFAFVPSATTGVSTVLRSLRLDRGDRVAITDHSYGAVMLAAKHICAQTGAALDVVEIPIGHQDPGSLILDAVTDQTKIAIVDHVTSPTARIMPIAQLVEGLRDRGVLSLVDAAHATGMVPVDVNQLSPDFWTCNFHKWVCAPRASGGLWAGPATRHIIEPLVVSWRLDEGFPNSLAWLGTADFSPYLATPAAFDFMKQLNASDLTSRNHRTVVQGAETVRDAIGSPAVPGRGEADAGWMDIIMLPEAIATTSQGAKELSRQIFLELSVEVAVIAWNHSGLLRLSAHAYNSPQDFEKLAMGLKSILDRTEKAPA